jgi:hypothetical protein
LLVLGSQYFEEEGSRYQAILAGVGREAHAGVRVRWKAREAWEQELCIRIPTVKPAMDIVVGNKEWEAVKDV